MAIYTDILTGGSNNHETTSEAANYLATDFIAEGVVGTTTNTSGVAPSTGAFAVNAQGTPDMTVAVSTGVAYVTATPSGQSSQALRVRNTASANATIAANSSGSTKYDWVYLSVSAANAANPNVAGDNVTTIVVSRSTSATADDGTPPTYGYAIAVVTVANGASSITNGNITDARGQTGLTSNQLVGSQVARVATNQTTTSTSYTDLTTTGPTVDVVVGPSGKVEVAMSAYFFNSGANFSNVTFAASGANTIAAGTYLLRQKSASDLECGRSALITGLNPGRTTFTMKYSVAAGTGTFGNRELSVKPL